METPSIFLLITAKREKNGMRFNAKSDYRLCVDSFSGLDILVNNAAGIMFERRLEEMHEDEWHSMMAVNLDAPVFLCKYALPEMKKRSGGSIVNIGPIEGIGSNPLPFLHFHGVSGN